MHPNKTNFAPGAALTHLPYRPDIDGLRALAVLSVVIFHLNKKWLPGGFAGVDVFFVISGYLITLLVYGEISSGKFSFTNFYQRRINRLFPALFTVLFACVVVGIVMLAPKDLVRLTKSAAYALVGFSNFFFWKEYGSYFASGVEEAPLLNTWSLAVEEQFYVFWPALLIFLARLPLRILIVIALAGLILTVSVSEFGVQNAATASYYLLPARFFELLIGSVLALLVYHRLLPLGQVGALICGVAGLLLMFGSFFLLGDAGSFPGINALFPCVGAVLVIASGSYSQGVVTKVLANRALVFFGLISYSLYLWHWPIIAYFRYADVNIGAAVGILIFLLSTLIAWLSWRFVEVPFRRNGMRLNFGKVFTYRYLMPVVVVASASFAIMKLNGLPERFNPQVERYEAIISTAPNEVRRDCHVPTAYYQKEPDTKCLLGKESKDIDGILIGDSYANHFTGMIDVLAKRDGVTIMDYTMDGCLPIKGVKLGKPESYAEKCKLRNDYSYEYIRSKRYKYVILAGSWPLQGSPEYLDSIKQGLEQSLGILLESGARPIVILNNPRIKNANKCPVRRLLFNRSESCDATWSSEDAYRKIFAQMQKKYPKIIFIDPSTAICNDLTCKPQIGDVPLYRDDGHLNEVGSRLIGKILLDKGVHLLPG